MGENGVDPHVTRNHHDHDIHPPPHSPVPLTKRILDAGPIFEPLQFTWLIDLIPHLIHLCLTPSFAEPRLLTSKSMNTHAKLLQAVDADSFSTAGSLPGCSFAPLLESLLLLLLLLLLPPLPVPAACTTLFTASWPLLASSTATAKRLSWAASTLRFTALSSTTWEGDGGGRGGRGDEMK